MSERNTELAYLIAVSGLTALGFASVYIARRSEISWGSLGYAGFFIVLYLIAHLIARRTVPNADPYLLPMAGLLTAFGLTEIYRLGPDDAFKQGLWIVFGLTLFAAALIGLRRDYRARVVQVHLRHRRDRPALSAAPPGHRHNRQRRASGSRRRSPVPAGRSWRDR